MSIEIRELVIKSVVRSASPREDEGSERLSPALRAELLEQCRKLVVELVSESRRR